MKKLIEIHVLQNFAPSNLNRDDTGAPKDALFGGTRRARVSSQCLKRAVREYFKGLVEQGKLTPEDVATRTKRLSDALVKSLKDKGHGEESRRKRYAKHWRPLSFRLRMMAKTSTFYFWVKGKLRESPGSFMTNGKA